MRGGIHSILAGDLITAVEGQTVTGNDTLQRAMSHKRAGDILDITVYRNGKSQTIKVRLGEAPQVV